MIGIISYGAYVPLHRLAPETKGWGFPFEKAVGYYDEDSLTMGMTHNHGMNPRSGVGSVTILGQRDE